MPNQLTRFWNIASSGDGEAGELTIRAPLSSTQSWWDDSVYPKQFARDLRDLGNVRQINVRINSPGGDPFAGYAIHNMLREHPANVTVYVEGLAASAASIVALAGNEIVMPVGSMMMIHKPAMELWGSYRDEDLDRLSAALREVLDGMVTFYAARTTQDEASIRQMLEDETWMTAEHAVELGFADRVDDSERIAIAASAGTILASGVSFDFSKFGYRALPDSIKKEVTSMAKTKAETGGADEELKGRGGETVEEEVEETEAAETETEETEETGTTESTETEASETEQAQASERGRIRAIIETASKVPGSGAEMLKAIDDPTITAEAFSKSLIDSGAALKAGALRARGQDAAITGEVAGVSAPESEDQGGNVTAKVVGFMKELRGGK